MVDSYETYVKSYSEFEEYYIKDNSVKLHFKIKLNAKLYLNPAFPEESHKLWFRIPPNRRSFIERYVYMIMDSKLNTGTIYDLDALESFRTDIGGGNEKIEEISEAIDRIKRKSNKLAEEIKNHLYDFLIEYFLDILKKDTQNNEVFLVSELTKEFEDSLDQKLKSLQEENIIRSYEHVEKKNPWL